MQIHLRNIGKVIDATVEINGITVIGGENNTGKSTIGKALYSSFNCFHDIQNQIVKERLAGIETALRLIYSDIFFFETNQTKNIVELSREILDRAEEYKNNSILLVDELKNVFEFEGVSDRIERMTNSIEDAAKKIIEILNYSNQVVFDSVVAKKLSAEFDGQLVSVDTEEAGEVSLTVKNRLLQMKVKDETVTTNDLTYSLDSEAIYIDDPFILDEATRRIRSRYIYDNHRGQLSRKLFKINSVSVIEEMMVESRLKKIYEKISVVCQGELVTLKNGKLGYQKKGWKNFLGMNNLSTGIKTFAMLKKLLFNGSIEQNGMLILDEPEIHLHPEWQLVFAEIIVLLNIEFGINILLNTHSPYFLRAIQVYAAKYDRNDICKYYLSELNDGEHAIITDVTNDVDKIFAKLAEPLQKLEDERYNID